MVCVKVIQPMLVLASTVYNNFGICAVTGRAPSGYNRPNLSGSVHAVGGPKRKSEADLTLADVKVPST